MPRPGGCEPSASGPQGTGPGQLAPAAGAGIGPTGHQRIAQWEGWKATNIFEIKETQIRMFNTLAGITATTQTTSPLLLAGKGPAGSHRRYYNDIHMESIFGTHSALVVFYTSTSGWDFFAMFSPCQLNETGDSRTRYFGLNTW